MTDEELVAIRARAERWERKRSRLDRRALLAEVDRLRDELQSLRWLQAMIDSE